MNVRYVKEWADLKRALGDIDVPKKEYAEALYEMIGDLVSQKLAVDEELRDEISKQG